MNQIAKLPRGWSTWPEAVRVIWMHDMLLLDYARMKAVIVWPYVEQAVPLMWVVAMQQTAAFAAVALAEQGWTVYS